MLRRSINAHIYRRIRKNLDVVHRSRTQPTASETSTNAGRQPRWPARTAGLRRPCILTGTTSDLTTTPPSQQPARKATPPPTRPRKTKPSQQYTHKRPNTTNQQESEDVGTNSSLSRFDLSGPVRRPATKRFLCPLSFDLAAAVSFLRNERESKRGVVDTCSLGQAEPRHTRRHTTYPPSTISLPPPPFSPEKGNWRTVQKPQRDGTRPGALTEPRKARKMDGEKA